MIVPNQYNQHQVTIMEILTPVGEMKFEDLYKIMREKVPKMRRAQLAANVLQLHWNKLLIWDSPVGIKLTEDLIGIKRD